MRVAFVDETSDVKFKDYLGICVATVNAKYYPLLKNSAKKILHGIDWDPKTEFKGSYLFSRSSGCGEVEVEQRVKAAHALLDLNMSGRNSRLRFDYCRQKSQDHRADYLATVPLLLKAALGKAPKGAGKNLLAVHCDERDDISQEELHLAIAPSLEAKGYVLLENVSRVRSTFDTIGLMYADLVGYLRGRVDVIGNDSELFDGLSPEQFLDNGKVRKLLSSSSLVEKIKKLELYEAVRQHDHDKLPD